MSNSSIGGLIVLLLVIVVLAVSYLDWPSYAEHKARSTKDAYWKRKMHQPYGTGFYRCNGEKERHEHEHREDEKGFWIASKALSAVTIMIAAVAALFAYQAYTATRDQADIARDQEHRQLRAYLGIVNDSFNISCVVYRYPTEPRERFLIGTNGFSFQVKNFGATPASKVTPCLDLIAVPIETLNADVTAATENFFDQCEEKMSNFPSNPTVWPSDIRNQAFALLPDKISIYDDAFEVRRAGIFWD